MESFLTNSVFWGAVFSLLFYEVGLLCKKKWKSPLFNPLLISIILTILLLLVFKIPYSAYLPSAKYLNYLLTPATICLAIPLYEQIELLKKNIKAILAGIVSGVLTSMVTLLSLSALFGFTHEQYVTVLPKSITTAIGMEISRLYGGNVSVTVIIIILTGILGNIIAEPICNLFHINDPIARGVAIGTSSHAIGTTKANEIGTIEGAISGLSIAVAGICTVLISIVFNRLF